VTGDAFQARATHAPHRAEFHRLGLSVGIAIALAGCSADVDDPQSEASGTQYGTVGMIATSYGAAQGLAKRALKDGTLTNGEYDQVLTVDKTENEQACSYAKNMLADIGLGRLPEGFRPDMWWACNTGTIVAHDYGGASYADIIAGKQPSPYAVASSGLARRVSERTGA
jgi:hypothetical protein